MYIDADASKHTYHYMSRASTLAYTYLQVNVEQLAGDKKKLTSGRCTYA